MRVTVALARLEHAPIAICGDSSKYYRSVGCLHKQTPYRPSVATEIHIPAAFLRLSHSLQYFGQVIPAGTFPAAFSAFQSAPQARSRACSACWGSAGFFIAAGATVAAPGFALSALHFAT